MFVEFDPSIFFILILFGFLAAFIDSVVGGGGLISLPALLFIGLNPATAVATNKLASSIGATTSTIMFYRSGKINLHTVYRLFPLVFIGSMLGAWTVYSISPEVLKPVMLIMLIFVAIYTILKKDWGTISTYKKLTVPRFIIFAIAVGAIGFYDGFLGPGTGSFLIFAFLLIGFDFLSAAGNAKFLNFGSNIAALILFIYLGEVHYVYGITMGIAQCAGAWYGTRFALNRGTSYVRMLFIIVTILLLSKNIYDYLN